MLLRAYLPSRLVAVISSSTPPCGVRPVARESSAGSCAALSSRRAAWLGLRLGLGLGLGLELGLGLGLGLGLDVHSVFPCVILGSPG